MIDNNKDKSAMSRKIGSKVVRKLRSRRHSNRGVWFGLGMMGLVGWSVVVPTLLGAMLGVWLDNNHPAKLSWTLTLLLVGLLVGCLNAWHWVRKERNEIEAEVEDKDE